MNPLLLLGAAAAAVVVLKRRPVDLQAVSGGRTSFSRLRGRTAEAAAAKAEGDEEEEGWRDKLEAEAGDLAEKACKEAPGGQFYGEYCDDVAEEVVETIGDGLAYLNPFD